MHPKYAKENANSVDIDQTASLGAVLSGLHLLVSQIFYLRNNVLETIFFLQNLLNPFGKLLHQNFTVAKNNGIISI